jgi:23S rRNA pseudouridine1911/1915/1917 synthase
LPYISKDFTINSPIKAWAFLTKEFGFSMKEAQRAIDRKQLLCEGEVVKIKSKLIEGNATLLIYEPKPSGLKPIYENEIFALFDKPSGVLAHPRNRNTEYSLNDEIKYLYGKRANIVHRLDKETSGLILVSKDKAYESELKRIFEEKRAFKSYIALARGEIKEPLCIDAPILVNNNYDFIKLKVRIDERGKNALTEVFPIKYFEDLNATLVQAIPKTGRQHQIRAHLFHVEHSIVGDPIYGQSLKVGAEYLDGTLSEENRIKLCGAYRVLLHSQSLRFTFKGIEYNFKSSYDAQKEFEYMARR